MTTQVRRDLTVLHQDILAAKGGSFAAASVRPETPVPITRRVYRQVLEVPVLGGAARRTASVVRRVRAKVRAT